jgi:hypothetical protein
MMCYSVFVEQGYRENTAFFGTASAIKICLAFLFKLKMGLFES